MSDVKSEIIKLVNDFCIEKGTDVKLTIEYLRAICERKPIKNYLSFCKSCLERMNEDEIARCTIEKRYFGDLQFQGFAQDDYYRFLLIEIENHCLKEFPITFEEIDNFNKSMAKYCRENNIYDYQMLVGLALKSKTLSKCNIPLAELKRKVMAEISEWERIINEIESEE